MVRRAISIFVAMVMAVAFMGCPPDVIQDSKPYVEDAKSLMKQVNEAYPEVARAIDDSCEARLIGEEDCAKWTELKPAVQEGLVALEEAINLYSDAADAYKATLDAGSEEEINEAYKRINITVSVVLSNTADLVKLWGRVLSIYGQIK